MSMWVLEERKTSISAKSKSTALSCKWWGCWRNCKKKGWRIEMLNHKTYCIIVALICSAISMIWFRLIRSKGRMLSSPLSSIVHLSFWEIWGIQRISILIPTSWICILLVLRCCTCVLWAGSVWRKGLTTSMSQASTHTPILSKSRDASGWLKTYTINLLILW